jgi:hypothetical protein
VRAGAPPQTNRALTLTLPALLLAAGAAGCGFRGARLLARERRVRNAPDASGALGTGGPLPAGLARVTGDARSAGPYARSDIGNLPGLYVREVTARFTAEGDDGRRRPGAKPDWRVVRDVTRSVDFLLYSSAGDGTGAALVRAGNNAAPDDASPQPTPAEFLARHVARFYNDIPTDRWPGLPYEGDTRTEVFFVPSGARLTAWGRLAPPADNSPHPHLAPDPATGVFLVVDGPEERAHSPRAARLATALLLLAAAGTAGALTLAALAVGF